MLKHLFILTLLLTGFFYTSFAQIGGTSVYQFLNLQTSARGAAMGGSLLPGKSADVSVAQQNPSFLDSTVDGHFSLNYAPYFDDINLGNASYAYRLKRNYTLASGIQFIRYGNFNGYDASGYSTGSFSVGEYAIYQSLCVPVNKAFSVGGSLKFIISDFN